MAERQVLHPKPNLILGIESSCDDTAMAVVRNGVEVLSSAVSSQLALHQEFGGVVPEIAARNHLLALKPVLKQALDDAGVSLSEIEAVAVTQGPGLIGALLVGVSFAKGLAIQLGIPLIPVNHVHGHIYAGFLEAKESTHWPQVALVVSGGHTHLYRMQGPLDFQRIGASIDDACGECFDKVAKMIGLSYPGGPKVEALAKKGCRERFPMPRVLEESGDLRFSYSGLKTHFLNTYRQLEAKAQIDDQALADLCASFQYAALEQLVRKLSMAVRKFPDTRQVTVVGGVSANHCFRLLVEEEIKLPVSFPKLKYCSDNAAMIAALAHSQAHFGSDGDALCVGWSPYSRYEDS